LIHCRFEIRGKTTYKEEFVTAGGIDLSVLNTANFESVEIKNLFFIGEILNIDGITGGFNFQNAWTSAWIVAQEINNRI
jgi:predicted flavoprotein YhiN